jgi:hypothetical protein
MQSKMLRSNRKYILGIREFFRYRVNFRYFRGYTNKPMPLFKVECIEFNFRIYVKCHNGKELSLREHTVGLLAVIHHVHTVVPLHYALKEVWLHSFLSSALDGGEWSSSRPGRFTPGTHCVGDWVASRATLNAVRKRKILHLPGIEPRPSSP